jgi:hypothetical protein
MPRRTDISSILIIGVGLAAGPAAWASDPIPPYEATKDMIAGCGVPWANFSIAYEDALRSTVVRISDLGGTDEARLRCVREATVRWDPDILVEIRNPEQRRAYKTFNRPEEERSARLWLKTLGSDKHIPRYDPRRGLKAFARGVETGCWIPAGSALETRGPATLVVRRRFLGEVVTPAVLNAITCFRHMVEASNADRYDIVLAEFADPAPSVGQR